MKEGLARMPSVQLYTPRDENLSSGMVCFDVKGMKPDTVVERLLAQRIVASTTPYRSIVCASGVQCRKHTARNRDDAASDS